MLASATLCHWVALSTKFHFGRRGDDSRNRIIMTDHDFPSMLYAVSRRSR